MRKFVFGGSYTSFVFDPDALAYFAANTAITDDADKLAIDAFYKGLKEDGIYTKIKAMYLPKWGGAAFNKWNLIDPRDLDAAFRLTFFGGFTHASNGLIGSANSHADTHLAPASILSLNSTHISSYIGSAALSSSRATLGACTTSFAEGLFIVPNISNRIYYDVNSSSSGNNSLAMVGVLGLILTSRTVSTEIKAFKNGTIVGANSRTSTAPTANSLSLFAINNNGTKSSFYDGRQIFFTIGDGLSDTEQADLYTRVQTLMTYFGINV
jgi:hypothetical protein